MNDRGEKIVSLAREILSEQQNGVARPPFCGRPTGNEKNSALKAAAVAAFLTAIGTSAAVYFLDEMRRPINRYERVELDALVFYAAREARTDEAVLREKIRDILSLPSLQNMTTTDYVRVRKYLWDELDKRKNG